MATAAAATGKKIKDFVYEWEGRDRNGKAVRGEMRAGGEAMVSASLRRQGILVTKVKKRRISGGKSIKSKDIAVFTRQLATLNRVSPLEESLRTITRQTAGDIAELDVARVRRALSLAAPGLHR